MKKQCSKIVFFMFCFLETWQTCLLRSKIFISGWKEKQTWQPLITQTGRVMKKPFWNEEKHGWNQEILHEVIYVHLHKRKLLSPSLGLFFCAGSSLSLLLNALRSNFFNIVVFFFNAETKLKQQISQNTEQQLLYSTNCHANAWIWFHYFFYSQLQFFYGKLLDTPDEDHQVLGFVNPVVDPDDEDDNIFEPERRFSSAFNSFLNQWYIKKIKMYLSLHLGSMPFPQFLKCGKIKHIKIPFSKLRGNLHIANYSIMVKPGN